MNNASSVRSLLLHFQRMPDTLPGTSIAGPSSDADLVPAHTVEDEVETIADSSPCGAGISVPENFMTDPSSNGDLVRVELVHTLEDDVEIIADTHACNAGISVPVTLNNRLTNSVPASNVVNADGMVEDMDTGDMFHIGVERVSENSPRSPCVLSDKSTHEHQLGKSNEDQYSPSADCPWACRICGETFHDIQVFSEHVKAHKQKPFECVKCAAQFSGESPFDLHMRKLHPHLCCHVCSKHFSSTDFRDQHLVKMHYLNLQNESAPQRTGAAISDKLSQNGRVLKLEDIASCSQTLVSTIKNNAEICCDETFATRNSLEDRCSTADSGFTATCPVCDVKLNDEYKLKSHMLDHNHERPFECRRCGAAYGCGSALLVHTESCSDNRLRCSRCRRVFNTVIDYARHDSPEHGSWRPFACYQCEKLFSHLNERDRHVRKHNKKSQAFQCPQCARRFDRKPDYDKHSTKCNSCYHCYYCFTTFDSADSLQLHAVQHISATPFHCTVCLAEFNTRLKLVKHRDYETCEKPPECQGEQRSSNKAEYNSTFHTLDETNAEDVVQEAVNVEEEDALDNAQGMVQQVANGEEEEEDIDVEGDTDEEQTRNDNSTVIIEDLTPEPSSPPEKISVSSNSEDEQSDDDVSEICHMCNLCNIEFQTSHDLVLHEKFHHKAKMRNQKRTREKAHKPEMRNQKRTREKAKTVSLGPIDDSPFMCRICGETFYYIEVLDKHIQTHKQKPFECEKCAEPFDSAKFLLAHLDKHHPGFSCETCLRHFTTPESRQQHEHRARFTCDFCPDRFTTEALLDAHTSSHDTVVISLLQTDIQCPVCDDHLKTANALKLHMREHNHKQPYECRRCGQAFQHISGLLLHTEPCNKRLRCQKCATKFRALYAYTRHVATEHDSWRPFACCWCEKVFAEVKQRDLHVLKHNGRKMEPFQCDSCARRFYWKPNYDMHSKKCGYNECYYCLTRYEPQSLKRHARSHTGDLPFVCLICKSKFETRQELLNDRNLHTGEKPFFCKICGHSSFTKAEYEYHRKFNVACKSKKREQLKKYTCSECPARFIILRDRDKHMENHQAGVRCQRCFRETGCTDRYPSALLLEKHVEEKHRFRCTQCKRSFAREQSLNNHIAYHVNKDILNKTKCHRCGKRFETEEALIEHRAVCKVFNECDFCGGKFASEAGLEKHVKSGICQRQEPHQCGYCSKIFRTKRSLTIHQPKGVCRTMLPVHETQCSRCGSKFLTEKGFQKHKERGNCHYAKLKMKKCSYCGKSFRTNTLLKKHVRIHTGETPYLCSMCGKTFHDSTLLMKHNARVHYGRQYKCKLCPKRFFDKCGLRVHMDIHKGVSFKCGLCESSFSRKSYRLVHLRNVHNVDGRIRPPQMEIDTDQSANGDDVT